MVILFGMPIAQIMLFGFAITNEINNVDISILDKSKDATTKEIVNKISSSKYFSIKQNIANESEIEASFKKGKVINEVFCEHAYNLNISSTKSMTGHLLGAAGAIEAIACIKAIENNIVPPTINHFTDDPDIDNKLNFTFNKAQERTVKYALTNTFGFGGHNTSVIFKAYND